MKPKVGLSEAVLSRISGGARARNQRSGNRPFVLNSRLRLPLR
jgi:hypothetical protein